MIIFRGFTETEKLNDSQNPIFSNRNDNVSLMYLWKTLSLKDKIKKYTTFLNKKNCVVKFRLWRSPCQTLVDFCLIWVNDLFHFNYRFRLANGTLFFNAFALNSSKLHAWKKSVILSNRIDSFKSMFKSRDLHPILLLSLNFIFKVFLSII